MQRKRTFLTNDCFYSTEGNGASLLLPVHFLGLPGRLPCIPNLHPKFSSQNSANHTFLLLFDKLRLLKYLSKAEKRVSWIIKQMKKAWKPFFHRYVVLLTLTEILITHPAFLQVPSTEALLGRIVIAPSATFSCWCTGEIFEPQLSEPTQRKWFVWLFRLAASRTRLKSTWHRTNVCYSLSSVHYFSEEKKSRIVFITSLI